MIKLGSLFDGLGGWPLAAIKQGIMPAWASEIEPFPISVTEKHFPNMKHLGDITKINGAEIEPVDIITFGSPCQDLSVAGEGGGLDGARSGLFRDAVRIIREMRTATNNKYPRFACWENVPGAFSSNKGLDFRTVLEEITESKIPMPKSGRWATAGMVRGNEFSVAWRVLDAQYWGVPQRRKRIFLVADFGGCCAGEVLFKPESLRRDIETCGRERKRIAGSVAVGVGTTKCYDLGEARLRTPGEYDELSPTLSARMGTGGNNVPGVVVAYDSEENNEVANTILAKANLSYRRDMDNLAVSQCLTSGTGRRYDAETETLIPVAVDCRNLNESELSGMLQSKSSGGYSLNYQNPIRIGYRVRRLTPTECERLQGLPDGWTIGGSDTARYKAIGNGMAQPCPDYVMEGIAEILRSVSK